MDFLEVLQTAKKQNEQEKFCKRYSTAVSASKKEPRKKVNSEAIKRFLEKKENEEIQKVNKAALEKERLLQWRSQDKGTHKRLSAMLKLTKSANKSVLKTEEEQIGDNFAVDDDYGYVSRESQALHQKLMHLFERSASNDKKNRKELDAYMKKSKRKQLNQTDNQIPNQEDASKTMKEKVKRKSTLCKNQKSAPIISFQDLLKLAVEKQHEPLHFETKTLPKDKECEFERPMTAKEKEEYLRERARKSQANGRLPTPSPQVPNDSVDSNKKNLDKPAAVGNIQAKPHKVPETSNKQIRVPKVAKQSSIKPEHSEKWQKVTVKNPLNEHPSCEVKSAKEFPSTVQSVKKSHKPSIPQTSCAKPQKYSTDTASKPPPTHNPKQPTKVHPSFNLAKQFQKRKARLDSDDEAYSDLDDFIDDSPQDNQQDVTAIIREMFGYDRRRYRDEDDECMESNYTEMMKEEFHSTRAGILEDLAEIRRKKRLKMQPSLR